MWAIEQKEPSVSTGVQHKASTAKKTRASPISLHLVFRVQNRPMYKDRQKIRSVNYKYGNYVNTATSLSVSNGQQNIHLDTKAAVGGPDY